MELYIDLKNKLLEVLLQLYESDTVGNFLELLEGEQAVLSYLFKESHGVTPTDISHKIGITKARVTAILDALLEKELVKINRKKDDRRKVIVVLTEKGTKEITKKLLLLDNKIIKLIEILGTEKSKILVEILNDINQISKKGENQWKTKN